MFAIPSTSHRGASGLQKGLVERGHVKKRQKSSKSVKKFFDNFRAGQKRQKSSKSVKKFFDTFRQFSRGTIFPAPFGGLWLKWEIRWEVLPRVLPEIGVLRLVLPRVLWEVGGAPRSAPEDAQCGALTGRAASGALLGSTPNLPEHSRGDPREHFPEHFHEFPTLVTPVTGGCDCKFVRAACLQNETAPIIFNFKTKNGPKNDPKLPRKIWSLVLLCRISHRHYSKIFHREFPHKIKYFFTTRICRHGHAKNLHVEMIWRFWGFVKVPECGSNSLSRLFSKISSVKKKVMSLISRVALRIACHSGRVFFSFEVEVFPSLLRLNPEKRGILF